MDLIEKNIDTFAKIVKLCGYKNGYPDSVKCKALQYYLEGIGG